MRFGLHRQREGQGLLEAALIIPVLLIIVFNAVNLGYYFFVYLNLTTAPRQGAQYSILGSLTVSGSPPTPNSLPYPGDVNTLLSSDITGAIPSAASTPNRICTAEISPLVDAQTVNQRPQCQSYPTGSETFSADPNCNTGDICADPEAPALVLNRVDIQYTVTPLIPGTVFNIGLPSPIVFHRYVYMRAEGS